MDVVFTIGQYNLVSWALNSFGVPLGAVLDLPRLSKPYRQRQLAEQITALIRHGPSGASRITH